MSIQNLDMRAADTQFQCSVFVTTSSGAGSEKPGNSHCVDISNFWLVSRTPNCVVKTNGMKDFSCQYLYAERFLG